MAHKTRRRLTKTDLKKDPVNDALVGTMTYMQDHVKQFLIAAAAIIVLVLVFQAVSRNAGRQADEAVAQYYLAGQFYNMGMNSFQYGQYDMAMGQLQTARQVALDNFRAYPGRIYGKRSAILAAKIGILFGLESEVIPALQDFIASDPGEQVENSAKLHLAIALENRGGDNDLLTAEELYNEILLSVEHQSQLAWESNCGLSRVLFSRGDQEGSRVHLQQALEISRDTTAFMSYQMARYQWI